MYLGWQGRIHGIQLYPENRKKAVKDIIKERNMQVDFVKLQLQERIEDCTEPCLHTHFAFQYRQV